MKNRIISLMLLMAYVFNVIDAGFTYKFVWQLEIFKESNPIMLWLLEYNPMAFWTYKVLFVGIMFAYLSFYKDRRIAFLGAIACFVIYGLLMFWWMFLLKVMVS